MDTALYLYFLPSLLLLFWSVYLRCKPNRLKVHCRASETLFVLALTWFFFAGYYAPESLRYSFWVDFGFSVSASAFPAVYYLTIRELAGARGIRNKDRLVLIIPAFIFLLYLTVGIFSSPDEKLAYMQTVRNESTSLDTPMVHFAITVNYIFYAVTAASLLVICRWAINRKHRCVRMLKEYYVNINRESGDRIVNAVAFDFINVPIVFYMMFVPLGWQPQTWVQIVIFCFIAIVAFLSGLYFNNIRFSVSELRRQMLSYMDNGTVQEVIDEIREVMGETPLPKDFELMPEESFLRIRDEKMFLIHGLNLMILANKLGIKRNYIAHSIHHYVGTNFSNYIRSLRIDYTVDMLEYSDNSKSKRYTYRELAKQSGYSDKRMFRDDFVANTGMTLHHYLGY